MIVEKQMTTLAANLQASAHELVRRNTSRGGDTQEDIAQALGIERGRLSQILNTAGTPFPLHLAVALHRITRDDFLTQALCAACGGVFVPVSGVEGRDALPSGTGYTRVLELMAQASREQGEVVAAAAEALADHCVSDEEKAGVRQEILEAMSGLAKLLRAFDRLSPASRRADTLREMG